MIYKKAAIMTECDIYEKNTGFISGEAAFSTWLQCCFAVNGYDTSDFPSVESDWIFIRGWT